MKSTAESSSSAGALRRWLLALGLVLAVVFSYHEVWDAGFIWDDDLHLTANQHVMGGHGLLAIWTTGDANYFPLVLSHLWVLHALFGLEPLPYHLVSVFMHAGCALLLWRVLGQLRIPGAWLGAAVWALHPVQVESVAWISEIKNTQSAVFYLAALMFFLRWLERASPTTDDGRWRFTRDYALAAVCVIAAILSKSATVMLPVILALVWWWQRKPWRLRDAVWLAPFFAISLAAGLWTIWEQKHHSGAIGEEWVMSFAERLIVAGKVPWFYLGKLLWPQPLIFIYPRWIIDASAPLAYLPGVAVLGIAAVAWGQRARVAWRAVFFGTAYFLVSLFPVMGFFNVYFFRFSFVGDHLQYLASLGGIAAVAALLTLAWQRWSSFAENPWVGRGLAGALCLAAALRTSMLARNYHDSTTLYRSILAEHPECWMAQNNLGQILLAEKRRDEAIAHFRTALELNPKYSEAAFNLGSLALQDGRKEEALRLFERARDARPRDVTVRNSLAVTLERLGRFEEAERELRLVLEKEPGFALARNNLANFLFHQNKLEEASAMYREVVRVMPDLPEPASNLGLSLLRLGRANEAVPYFERAAQMQPQSAEAAFAAGHARLRAGDNAGAIPHLERAVTLQPEYPEALNDLGNALLSVDRVAEAAARYQALLQFKPDYAEAHNNLAAVLFRQGDTAGAIRHFETAVRLKPDYADARRNLEALRALPPRP